MEAWTRPVESCALASTRLAGAGNAMNTSPSNGLNNNNNNNPISNSHSLNNNSGGGTTSTTTVSKQRRYQLEASNLESIPA